MLIDWISAALPLATTEDLGVLGSLLSSLLLWGRVALGIGLVVFVHELGHFLAAKSFGVKCEKFYVGFDVPIRIGPIKFPRTLGKFRYGETEYGIGIIPLGGYVKMLGQDDDPRNQEEEAKRIQVEGEAETSRVQLDPRSFPAKPVWQRMIIISSGVVVNVITGVLFAAIAFGFGVSYSPAVVGGVTPGGPAWQAGIEPGGKVIAVGALEDDNMHFREMKMQILTAGLDTPDQPIDIAIGYDEGVRKFKLRTAGIPEDKDVRMIGLAIPSSLTLDKRNYADPRSVASEVLTEADAGASIVAFDGTNVNANAVVPGTPFFDYLYTHPNKTIQLTLKRADGSQREIALPPQRAMSIGVRFAIGPVVALVDEGPAAKAGMQVGDVIKAVGENKNPDAYGVALDLVGMRQSVTFTVQRGEGADAKDVEITVTPGRSLQTLPPTTSMTSELAINAFGFAYRPLPTVSSVVPANETSLESDGDASGTNGDVLQPGDQLQEVRLVWQDEEVPQWLKDERYERALSTLRKGWEFNSRTPLNTFREVIQLLPPGTKLQVAATRPPQGRVVSTTVVITADDRMMFDRGLGLVPSVAIQQAGSVSEALALGYREGQRRFMDVIRFLKMLPRGRVKLRHVGGPLEIVNIAKNEAEKGISPQLLFLTMLSMNLAILNFLPIPALDGGHMVFLLYELVVGKRANEQLEFRLTVAGLLSLLALMVVVFANDILRHLN